MLPLDDLPQLALDCAHHPKQGWILPKRPRLLSATENAHYAIPVRKEYPEGPGAGVGGIEASEGCLTTAISCTPSGSYRYVGADRERSQRDARRAGSKPSTAAMTVLLSYSV